MNQNNYAQTQLQDLRDRLKEIRIAKRWIQDYRINASPPERNALAAYYNWLCDQEEKTCNMGKRIKAELEKHSQ